MIASLKSRAMGWVLGGLAVVSAYLYWQHITTQRDAYQAEAERQQSRADILQEHQQWQRRQIEALNAAMAERDRALTIIADDMRASTAALQSLGESDAEAREWLDSDLPSGITDWLRQLQQPSADDAVRLPDGAELPDE